MSTDPIHLTEIHAYREGMAVVREMIAHDCPVAANDLLLSFTSCDWASARGQVNDFYRGRLPKIALSLVAALDILTSLSTAPLPIVRGTESSPSWWAAAAGRDGTDARWALGALSQLGADAGTPYEVRAALLLLYELPHRPDGAIPWPPTDETLLTARTAIMVRHAGRSR